MLFIVLRCEIIENLFWIGTQQLNRTDLGQGRHASGIRRGNFFSFIFYLLSYHSAGIAILHFDFI